MNTALILHDTKRNVAANWPGDWTDEGLVGGLVVSLHNSPPDGSGIRNLPDISSRTSPVKDHGGLLLVDACSHVDLASTDPDTYDRWHLWPSGVVGDFTTDSTYDDHVRRVFEIQRDQGAPLMVPSPLLGPPNSTEAAALLRMASRSIQLASEVDPDSGPPIMTLAGRSTFWASERLDAFVDRLSQMPAGGYYLVPVQSDLSWPARPTKEELAGLLRTTFSVSMLPGPVIGGHVDLLGIPMAAAGVDYVGTGIDQKQRCLDPESHQPVEMIGGRWLGQVTLAAALAAVSEPDAAQLAVNDPTLANRLMPPHGAVPALGGARVRHHMRVLRDALATFAGIQPGEKGASHALNSLYGRARRHVDMVEGILPGRDLLSTWIRPAEDALEAWAQDEHWDV